MDQSLHEDLRRAGWKPGTFKGFLRTSRAGIEFQVGEVRASSGGRLELRYRYRTERTEAEGEVALPDGARRAQVEDAMTGIYLRIHEKPDVTRVFGGRGGARSGGAPRGADRAAAGEGRSDQGQETLDL